MTMPKQTSQWCESAIPLQTPALIKPRINTPKVETVTAVVRPVDKPRSDMTSVPLETLKRLIQEAQYISQGMTADEKAVTRLRNAGKAFDEACRDVGIVGNTHGGENLSNLTKTMADMVAIQGASGTYDIDPYNHGLVNGMIHIQAIAQNQEIPFVEAPAEWIGWDTNIAASVDTESTDITQEG
jgi:hypothetical protein